MQQRQSQSVPRVPPNTPATGFVHSSAYASAPAATQSPSALQVVLTRPSPTTPPPPPSQQQQQQQQQQQPAPLGPVTFAQRVCALPLVACAIDGYQSARAEGDVLSLGIMCSEIAVGLATLPLRAVAAPMAMVCPWPVRVGDRLLCLWLDLVEMMVPCIKGPPRKMCRPVRICYRTSRGKIRAIPGLVWMSTNDLLSTSCGELLMTSADKIMVSYDGYVDVILPSPDSPDAYWFKRLLSGLAHMPTNIARRVYDILRGLLDHVARRAQEAREAAAEAEALERARQHHARRIPGKKLFVNEE